MLQPIEDQDDLSVDREARPRNQRMTGEGFSHRFDDQVFGPIDGVNHQADDPASRPD